jgi:phosphatidylserine/phosphatidylglycerophosphate/cardiolipin synthase-like enzyme
MDRARRSAMHAKCVVVDRCLAFVSSANFTLAAQQRNIEVGVIVREPALSARLEAQFDGLVTAGLLVRLNRAGPPVALLDGTSASLEE